MCTECGIKAVLIQYYVITWHIISKFIWVRVGPLYRNNVLHVYSEVFHKILVCFISGCFFVHSNAFNILTTLQAFVVDKKKCRKQVDVKYKGDIKVLHELPVFSTKGLVSSLPYFSKSWFCGDRISSPHPFRQFFFFFFLERVKGVSGGGAHLPITQLIRV